MGQPGAQACLGFLESASLGNWQLPQLNQAELCCQWLGADKSSSFQKGCHSTRAVRDQNCHPIPHPAWEL